MHGRPDRIGGEEQNAQWVRVGRQRLKSISKVAAEGTPESLRIADSG
jgi:hypothetical protein